MSQQPLIEERRVRFSGLSSEAFADIERGKKVTFTVVATCSETKDKDMKTEGDRFEANMKIEKVSLGIDPRINDAPPEEPKEPSLFDGRPDDAAEDQDDDEGATVSPIGTEFEGGPTFSAGDE